MNQIDFSTILASSVHDMKNSLGLLLSTLDSMTEQCGQCERSSKEAQCLRYEANRLNGNLLQLLTLYKINRQHVVPDISHHRVFDFLEENLVGNEPLLDAKGITLELECQEDLVWFFDRELLAGVLNNILNNAFKYAGDRMRVSAVTEADGLVLRIEDNGRGYPASMLGPYSDERNSVSFQSGSTGLGLYFAAVIASLHKNGDRQGSVVISNGGGLGGGCFAIHLP